MSVWRGFGLLRINRALREIRNYTNGRKTRENIRFKFKSFKSKWLTLYVRNRFRRKIFRLKLGIYRMGSGIQTPLRGRWRLWYWMVKHLLTIYGVVAVMGVRGYGVEGEVFCISVVDIPICVLFAVCAGDFWNTKRAIPKNWFVIEMLLFLIFRRKNVWLILFGGRWRRRRGQGGAYL